MGTLTATSAVLRALARRGVLTPAELSGQTRFPRRLVQKAVRELRAQGVLRAQEGHPIRLRLDPALGLAAAVHIGHHEIRVAVVDVDGEVCAEREASIVIRERRAEQAAALVRECMDERPLVAAVVAVPGIIDPDGGLRDDEGPDGGMLSSTLSAELGCVVKLENETNLAALAEARFGVGQGIDSFALLYLGSRLGAGLILDGKLRRGASGLAGEVEHLPHPSLPLAAPVLNDVVVADLALTLGGDPAVPLSGQLDACLAGDEIAAAIVEKVVRRYFIIAASIALVCDPEVFVFSGYATHPAFLAAAERYLEEYSPLLTFRAVSAELGDDASLKGAASEATTLLRDTVIERITTR